MIKKLSPEWRVALEQYGWWLLILVVLTGTLFQLHAAYVYIWLVIIENPDLRPVGWSTNTLHALSRIGYLGAGILWIIIAYMAEHQLHQARKINQKRKIALTYIFALFGLLIISYISILF